MEEVSGTCRQFSFHSDLKRSILNALKSLNKKLTVFKKQNKNRFPVGQVLVRSKKVCKNYISPW